MPTATAKPSAGKPGAKRSTATRRKAAPPSQKKGANPETVEIARDELRAFLDRIERRVDSKVLSFRNRRGTALGLAALAVGIFALGLLIGFGLAQSFAPSPY